MQYIKKIKYLFFLALISSFFISIAVPFDFLFANECSPNKAIGNQGCAIDEVCTRSGKCKKSCDSNAECAPGYKCNKNTAFPYCKEKDKSAENENVNCACTKIEKVSSLQTEVKKQNCTNYGSDKKNIEDCRWRTGLLGKPSKGCLCAKVEESKVKASSYFTKSKELCKTNERVVKDVGLESHRVHYLEFRDCRLVEKEKNRDKVNTEKNKKTPTLNNDIRSQLSSLDKIKSSGSNASQGVSNIIGQAIVLILQFAGTAALLMFVYGGLLIMVSQGQSDKYQKGAKIMMWSAIGIIVMLSSYGILNFILAGLGA